MPARDRAGGSGQLLSLPRPPRIHGEILKLGIEVSQATVAEYMVRQRKPPSQTWRTFLENHVPDIAAIDSFVVATVSFRLLYCFLVLRHDRRRVVHFNATQTQPRVGQPSKSSRPSPSTPRRAS